MFVQNISDSSLAALNQDPFVWFDFLEAKVTLRVVGEETPGPELASGTYHVLIRGMGSRETSHVARVFFFRLGTLRFAKGGQAGNHPFCDPS